MKKRFMGFGIVLMLAMVVAPKAFADVTWDGGGGADTAINTAANWTTDTVPSGGSSIGTVLDADTTYVSNNGQELAGYNIVYNGSSTFENGAVTKTSFFLGGGTTTSMTFNDTSSAFFARSGGMNLSLGFGAGTSGAFTWNSSETLGGVNELWVAYSGSSATYLQTDGTVTGAANINIGTLGTLTLSGGTMNFTTGSLNINAGGTLDFLTTGMTGTVHVASGETAAIEGLIAAGSITLDGAVATLADFSITDDGGSTSLTIAESGSEPGSETVASWNFTDGDHTTDSAVLMGTTVGAITGFGNSSGDAIGLPVHDVLGASVNGKKIRIGVAKSADKNDAFMRFTVAVDAAHVLNLTRISFEQGADHQASTWTPMLTLDVYVGGSATPTQTMVLNNFGALSATEEFLWINESAALSGLTGLTDTSVEFVFNFNNGTRQNTMSNYSSTLDDIVLAGTVSDRANPPPVIYSFTASPSTVDPGETVTLSWSAIHADTLVIDQGIGDVSGMTSTPVVVNAETIYTLTAGNMNGTDVADTMVRLRLDAPNILVVIVDDMGTEDTSVDFNYDTSGTPIGFMDPTAVGLSAFTNPGNNHFRTPNMETLSANGMKFTRAYACQVCSPTRCSLMTGQNSAHHGTIQYLTGGGTLHNIKMPANPGLKDYNRTLAETLRDAGYRTIVAGKGHIGDDFNVLADNYINPAAPADDYYGFQVNVSASMRGMHGSCYSTASPAFGLNRAGSEEYFSAEYQNKTYNQLDPVNYPSGHPQANEPVFITEALSREMIERIEASVDERMPFFAYLSHYVVHDPHQPDPRFTANYPGLTGDTLDFATMIEGMDQSLGDVIAKLEELGVAEDTLIVFLGDNGSDSKPRGPLNPPTLTMSNPLRGEKGMRFEGGIRVPLIVSWAKPDATNPFQQAFPILSASRESDLVAVEDIFPTVLAAAGIPVPSADDEGNPLVIDGSDLGPYLRGTAGTHRPQKLITHAPCTSRSAFFTTYHDGTWKLIYNYTTSSPDTSSNVPLGTYELYDLATDPHEADNLAASEPAHVMRMARDMVVELERLGAAYPLLISADADLAALGLPSAANDDHPAILPDLSGVDLDADGLDDNAEDPNRNGLVDADETDPDNDNTDGDNTPDGAEFRTGTDPLDPSDDFVGEWIPDGQGGFTATWPSKSGAFYEIQTTDDLMDWVEAPVATDIPASDPGTTTSYTVPEGTGSQRFYRIALLPLP